MNISRMGKITRCMLLLVTAVLLFAGCADNKPADPPFDQVPAGTSENQLAEKTEKMTVTLYFATQDASALVAEKREVAKNSHPARTAIEELINGPRNPALEKVVPGSTKLKEIQIKNHVAYVDFSQALVKEHSGGSAGEILTVSAIINTLTEYSDIKRVQFMVEGKKLETLTGHLDLSEPLMRNEAIIKK